MTGVSRSCTQVSGNKAGVSRNNDPLSMTEAQWRGIENNSGVGIVHLRSVHVLCEPPPYSDVTEHYAESSVKLEKEPLEWMIV